jgi:hypothetical protein
VRPRRVLAGLAPRLRRQLRLGGPLPPPLAGHRGGCGGWSFPRAGRLALMSIFPQLIFMVRFMVQLAAYLLDFRCVY